MSHVSLGKDAPCTRAIERFGDIVAHPAPGNGFWGPWAVRWLRFRLMVKRATRLSREIATDDADAVVRGGVDGAAEDINRLLSSVARLDAVA